MAQATVRLPPLYPKQAAFVDCEARYTVVEATTKAGKTVACLCWLLKQACETGKENRHYWWIAPIFPQAKIAYRRLKQWLKDAGMPAKSNDSELMITLENGAVMEFRGADRPDSLYGEDVYAAVMDEATRCKEEAWHAVRSTLTATRGKVKIIGNVRGRKNWAYMMARRAEVGEPDMAYFKLTTYDAADAGIYPLEEIEDAKRNLPSDVFKELYLAEPADDGGNPFGLDAIDACIVPMIPSANACVWGIDLAESTDWTVAIGLDSVGYVCQFHRFQRDWGRTHDDLLRIIGDDAPCLIDATGVGKPVVERLQSQRARVEGFQFTSASKQEIMGYLRGAIQRKEVRFPEGVLSQELRNFEYVYSPTSGVRYSAPEGLHDDCVCALALAVTLQARLGYRVPVRLLDLSGEPDHDHDSDLDGVHAGWNEL